MANLGGATPTFTTTLGSPVQSITRTSYAVLANVPTVGSTMIPTGTAATA